MPRRTKPLTGRQRRRVERLYRRVAARGTVYVRRSRDARAWGPEGRDAARLEAQGRVTVEVTKVALFGRLAGCAIEVAVRPRGRAP